MRILHVIIGLGAGGAENMLRRLVESQHGSTEFSHSVVSLTDTGQLGESMISAGVEVEALGMSGMLNAPLTMLRLTRMIRRRKPDIVQTWMYHADLMGGLAARAAGVERVIWGIRNTDMIKGTAYSTFVIRRVCAVLSRWVPTVIVCAADASRMSHSAIGYVESKMIVIANGFELNVRPPDRSNRRRFRAWSDDQVVIGCVGRFNFYKDHENFIRSAGMVARRFPSARFVMIGKGLDIHNSSLWEHIAATGFADRFALLGFRDDVADCLTGLDIFCLSSRSEGFPNVVGEAMAAGIPCVATDVGDVRLLLTDAGVIVPKEDSVALCQGLAKVISMTAEQRQAMGQRGRDRIAREFSMSKATERFSDLYRLMSKQRRG